MKNVFSSWVYYFVQFGIGFLMLPFMIHHLGDNLYGIWVLVLSFSGYIGFFDFGIRGSVVKFVAEYETKGNKKELLMIINTSWVIHLALSCIILLLTIILAQFIHLFFKLNITDIDEFRLCFILIGLNLGLNLATSVFVSVIEGFKRQDIVSGIEIVFFILQSTLIVIAVLFHAGLVMLGSIVLITTVLKQGARISYVSKIFPEFALNFSYFNKDFLGLLMNYSIFLFIYQSLRNIINSLPNVLLGAWLGGASITFYSVGTRLVGYCSIFLTTTSGTLLPFISSFESLKDNKRLKKSFIAGSKYSYMLAIFFGGVLLIMGKPLIQNWIGAKYSEASYSVLFISSMPLLLAPSAFIVNAILQGVGKLRTISVLTFLELIFSVTLSSLLIKPLGIKGIALGLSIPYLINYGLIIPILIIKNLEISFSDYLREVFVKTAIPALSLFIFLSIFKLIFYPNNFLILSFEILSGAVIYVVLCFYLTIEKEERLFFLSKIRLKS